jgi:geranylgeranyl pyrophosphate synthase
MSKVEGTTRVVLCEILWRSDPNLYCLQDDYLDCYGAPEVIGKIGTDIEDNKCSWLVVQALERVTPEQRLILEQNYGKRNADNVRILFCFVLRQR